MPEESPSLSLIFRRKAPPEKESQAEKLAREAAQDAWDFIKEAAAQVRYHPYVGRLSLSLFTRLLSLAISDEFEDVDEGKRQMLMGDYPLDEARSLNEYAEIRESLLSNCADLSAPESKEAWMARAEPQARRALIRAFRDAEPRDAGRAAEQVLDRTMPKISKLAEEPKPISLDEDAGKLIESALARHRKALGEGKE